MPDYSHILLVTDLDGTFFGHGTRLVPRNLEAIRHFKAHGGHFTTATGRIWQNIAQIIPQAAELFNAPGITCNGAYLHDFSSGLCYGAHSMDAEKVVRLIEYAQALNPHVAARISTDKGFLANADRLNDMVRFDLSYYDDQGGAEILPLAEWRLDCAKWYKMVIRGTYEELCTLRPRVEAEFGDAFEYSSSSPTFFEIQAGGCTKATAMRHLGELLSRKHGHPITTVAVGDHENDLPMLMVADISACPDNALPEVKAVCDHHLCECDDGCIADLIERL